MTTEELHLDNIQTGMEITTITLRHGKIEYGAIKVVGDYSEQHKKWRLRFPNESRGVGLLPNDGAGYMFMQKRDTPPSFYYSANLKHIKAAKKAQERIRKRVEKEERETKGRLAEFKQKLDNLLNEYDASIYAEQLSGDDQGVEVGMCISINNQSLRVDWD
jgi:hypothetical protein